jgi:hypothetical protein
VLQPDERQVCATQDAALAAAVAASTSNVLQLEDMSGLFIMEGAAMVLAFIIRFRRYLSDTVKRRRTARLALLASSTQLAEALAGAAGAMGGEKRPHWDRSADDDADLESHPARQHVVGGMEGRLTQLVQEHTASLVAEVEALKSRLVAKTDGDQAFQKLVLAKLDGAPAKH